MDENPYRSPQAEEPRKAWLPVGLFKMTVMELAVVCWIATFILTINGGKDAKLDNVTIIGYILSATITLAAIVIGIPGPKWFHFKFRLVLLLLLFLLLIALILPALQPARESGSRRPKPTSSPSEFEPESEIPGSHPLDVDT